MFATRLSPNWIINCLFRVWYTALRRDQPRPTYVARPKGAKTDGPFAETREQLGGYYLVEAKDLDAALAIAARIPGARFGSIEVRPIWVYN